MKQLLLTLTLLLLFLSGCNRSKPVEKVLDTTDPVQLNDTISKLISNYVQKRDTLSLNYALMFADELLTLDTLGVDKVQNYSMKIQILSMLGRNREAYMLNDQLLPRDNNNIDRLIYDGAVKKMYGDAAAADKYWGQAMKKCDSILSKKDSVDIVIKKISILTFEQKKAEAEKLIDKALTVQPYNQTLGMIKKQYDQQYEYVQDMMK